MKNLSEFFVCRLSEKKHGLFSGNIVPEVGGRHSFANKIFVFLEKAIDKWNCLWYHI